MRYPTQLVALMALLRDGTTLEAEQAMSKPRNTVFAFKVQEEGSVIHYAIEIWDEDDLLSHTNFAGADETARQFKKLVGPERTKAVLDGFYG